MSSELPAVYLVALKLQPAASADPNNVIPGDLGVSPVGPGKLQSSSTLHPCIACGLHTGNIGDSNCLNGNEERLDSNDPATGFSPQTMIQVDNDVVPELIDNNVPDHTIVSDRMFVCQSSWTSGTSGPQYFPYVRLQGTSKGPFTNASVLERFYFMSKLHPSGFFYIDYHSTREARARSKLLAYYVLQCINENVIVGVVS
ncbi:uncharacterized protein B0H18DRAFT_952513 [Fomitopsis serialis]|uniref:uncharacterized protein n=1 Tax=Fomitopsis serialis TaxID=139415 RepID=UPI002007C18A|nr:uncharacterized protein B0H18DRAFT_952513 [Neoantrodia serialis]KAH9931829.1 hypothetical protein B0H18DRAFT_952513 [Neoantrodia serialis]